MEVELEEREGGVCSLFFLFLFFKRGKRFSSLVYQELGVLRQLRLPVAIFLWTEITWTFFFPTGEFCFKNT